VAKESLKKKTVSAMQPLNFTTICRVVNNASLKTVEKLTWKRRGFRIDAIVAIVISKMLVLITSRVADHCYAKSRAQN
jgi:hypothetical protein